MAENRSRSCCTAADLSGASRAIFEHRTIYTYHTIWDFYVTYWKRSSLTVVCMLHTFAQRHEWMNENEWNVRRFFESQLKFRSWLGRAAKCAAIAQCLWVYGVCAIAICLARSCSNYSGIINPSCLPPVVLSRPYSISRKNPTLIYIHIYSPHPVVATGGHAFANDRCNGTESKWESSKVLSVDRVSHFIRTPKYGVGVWFMPVSNVSCSVLETLYSIHAYIYSIKLIIV